MVRVALHIDEKIRAYQFYSMKEFDLFRMVVYGLIDIRSVPPRPMQEKSHGSR